MNPRQSSDVVTRLSSASPLQSEISADANAYPASPLLEDAPSPITEADYFVSRPDEHAHPKRRYWVMAGSLAGVLLVVTLFVIIRGPRPTDVQAGSFSTTDIPLSSLNLTPLKDTTQSLRVNGQLAISDSIVLKPSEQPTSPVTGQLYFDKAANNLQYFNGEAFVGIGSGTTNNLTNNVTNINGTGRNQVDLQSTDPGVQQTGNFNISGTGQVGTLKTTVVDSGGGTLYFSPVGQAQQQIIAPGTPATLGTTDVAATTTAPSSIAGLDIASKVISGTTGGTAKTVSVWLEGGSAANHIQVALYADDGNLPSRPGALLGASAIVNLVPNAWNTVTVPDTALEANSSYWIAFNTDDSTVSRRYANASNSACYWTPGFGSMQDPFAPPGPCFFAAEAYSIYVTYLVGAGSSGALSQALFALSGTGQAIFRNSTDSPTAFQVQDAAGTSSVFAVDTSNGRIAIGKSNASYKLDIANGDINLSSNRSIRFSGLPALSVVGSGVTTVLSNFTSGGLVSIQSDNFAVQDASANHRQLEIASGGAATFSNSSDSTAGFQIQNSLGAVLFRADTSGMNLYVGNPAGSATPVILYLANKNTADDPAGAQSGGTYYNSSLESFRCFYTGFWHNCADLEPQHSFTQYDEFLGGQTSFTGNIGSLGWNALAIGGSGSLALNPATPTPSADRPGVLQLQTPGVLNQGTTLLLGNASGGSMIIGKDNDTKTALAVGAATGQVARVGLHSETTATTQPLSGVWWEADPAASANWRYCYGDGATATCAASSVAIAANTWVTLEIRVTATGAGTSTVFFIINNTPFSVTGVTVDTTGRVSPALSCYSTSGAAQNCYWDYFQITGTTSARR